MLAAHVCIRRRDAAKARTSRAATSARARVRALHARNTHMRASAAALLLVLCLADAAKRSRRRGVAPRLPEDVDADACTFHRADASPDELSEFAELFEPGPPAAPAIPTPAAPCRAPPLILSPIKVLSPKQLKL